MARRENKSLLDYHNRLFRERPVTLEAIVQLDNLCDDEYCQNIEGLAVKCALNYIRDAIHKGVI